MAKNSRRAGLVLTVQQRAWLKELAASRSTAARGIERAKVMLGYADGLSVTEPQRQLGFSRPMIYRCVDKAWVVSMVCTKPKGHGLAAELWSTSALAEKPGVQAIICLVLGKHATHISKETMACLGERPGRFEYVHTPKHGSWLNLIECAFSKMARTFRATHPGHLES
jgi:hypothetical protein